MKRINIETIPIEEMRYDTVGDYYEESGIRQFRIADMKNEDYEFLVLIHEMIEEHLTRKRGISEESITAFDVEFEKNRKEGNIDEPGHDINAPYHKEHVFAECIERLIAQELGVDWKKYDDTVNTL
jgi:hypothetical protein